MNSINNSFILMQLTTTMAMIRNSSNLSMSIKIRGKIQSQKKSLHKLPLIKKTIKTTFPVRHFNNKRTTI